MFSYPRISPTVAALFAVLLILLWFGTQQWYKPRSRSVGIQPGLFNFRLRAAKRDWAKNGHLLIREGYHKYPNENFYVQASEGERLVISPKFLPEIRMLPITTLSHPHATIQNGLGRYTGIDLMLENRQHADVCQINLTQNIPKMFPTMIEEFDHAFEQFSESQNLANKPVSAYAFSYQMCLAIAARAWIGLPECRDPTWSRVLSSFLTSALGTATALRPYPDFLRPLVRPWVAPKGKHEQIITDAENFLRPIVRAREKGDADHVDLLQFLINTSKTPNLRGMAIRLMVLAAAALFSTTNTLVNGIYDLCARPDVYQILREEADEAFKSTSGVWEFATVKKMHRLDSFLRESMRYHPHNALNFARVATSSFTLSNGEVIPKGTFISMATQELNKDPSNWTDPDTFDPLRFYPPQGPENGHKTVQDEEKAILNPRIDVFASIGPKDLNWGNGRFTCPGRWFASALIKLVIAKLLVEYDLSFPDGQTTRPTSIFVDDRYVIDRKQEIVIRRRNVAKQ